MTTFKVHGIWKQVLAQCLADRCPIRQAHLTRLTAAYTAGAGHGALLEREGANQRPRPALVDQGAGQQFDPAPEPVSE